MRARYSTREYNVSTWHAILVSGWAAMEACWHVSITFWCCYQGDSMRRLRYPDYGLRWFWLSKITQVNITTYVAILHAQQHTYAFNILTPYKRFIEMK